MSKLIEKLTPEQEAMIPVYLKEFLDIGMSTTPCDRAKAEDAINRSQAYLKLPKPVIIWADSPSAGAVIAAQLKKGSYEVTQEEVREQASEASYGSFEAYWGSHYCFIAEQLPVQKDELASIVRAIMENCGVYWTFEGVVVLTEKPIKIMMKDKKLHCEDGLALEYKDGSGIFAIEGNVYPSLLEMTIQKSLGKK